MKLFYKSLAALLLATTLTSSPITIVQAKTISLSKMKGEGFRKCKAQGKSGYTAVIKGSTLTSGTKNALAGKFSIRSCYKTKSECNRFARNIPNLVSGINTIEYSACKPRN